MPSSSRLVLVLATAAALALGAGGGVASAHAASAPSPLSLSVAQIQPVLVRHVGPSRDAAGDRAVARGLTVNAASCAEAVKLVAPIPAATIGDQVRAKRDWLTGVRLRIVADRRFAAGLEASASGHAATGASEMEASSATFLHSDRDIARADGLLGLG